MNHERENSKKALTSRGFCLACDFSWSNCARVLAGILAYRFVAAVTHLISRPPT